MKDGFEMRLLSMLVLGALTAGCSYGPPQPVSRSPMAQDRLAKELAGLVPGQPVSCLPHYRSQDMTVIDDNTLLFRDGGRVYRNELQVSCPLGPAYTLVTRSNSSSLCRGDIASVTDIRNHFTIGSCVLGDFVPYSRP
jgi:hypothetical protein